MLQARMSRVRFPMRTLDFSLHLILPAILWPSQPHGPARPDTGIALSLPKGYGSEPYRAREPRQHSLTRAGALTNVGVCAGVIERDAVHVSER
jgi:hypothetical protein